MTTGRSYRCPHCLGVVSIPRRARWLTIGDVEAIHLDTCPGILRVKR